MALSNNMAVRAAYEAGTYTDKKGTAWRRGMDGWFDDDYFGGRMLCRHHDFVALIEKENPDE